MMPTYLKYNLGILFIFFMFHAPCASAANCVAGTTGSPLPFGSSSSINIGSNQKTSSTDNAGIRCGGGLLSILSTYGTIKATVTTTNNGLLKHVNGTTLPYSIYAAPDYSNQITLNTPKEYYQSALLELLGFTIGNTALRSFPLYLRTNTGTYNLTAGTYTDKITINWNWDVCSGVSALFICLGRNIGQSTWVGDVTLTIASDCIINAPNINFGAYPLVSSFTPVRQTMTVYCTKGTNYSIGMNNGSNASGTQRRLGYNGNYINYEIYHPNTTIRWGNVGNDRRFSTTADINPGSGSGLSSLTQGFFYQMEILSGQLTPPAGTYTDTITLDIAF